MADDDDAHVERVMPVITAPDRNAAPLVLVVELLDAAAAQR
ncbi:hypothetical protein FHX44_113682 [Pseudonocardia hierapolitana]|uniref:Uncharacterized protein n=1 Tax=Pseudonocardia hierapolitana TaxID=1128676 RepID=A0A561SSC1_9PSEU|nr:hypothetical protein FHX44_113682 [Pseudonocardia hierapolitana]